MRMITDKFSFADTFRFVEREERSAAERKASLRRTMKERRGENENRDVKETLLLENFLRTEAAGKESFLVYLSFSSEAPTDKLVETLLAQGRRVYCPRMAGESMEAVAWKEDFTLSPRGIREPVGDPFSGKIDVAVLPLLAVDERGVRLGYGGGCYDRFLAAHPETFPLAYCFDFQIVREVPEEPFDRRAALIVSDKRILVPGGKFSDSGGKSGDK